jgi:hypothetical protein
VQVDYRLRTLGEILDDGTRLLLRDLGPLYFLSTLFATPWLAMLLWCLTEPTSAWTWLLGFAAAGLMFMGGLGPGACQELLRQRAADRRPGAWDCIRGALARAPVHMALRILWLVPLLAIAIVTKTVSSMASYRWPWEAQAAVGLLLILVFALPVLLLLLRGLTGHAQAAEGLTRLGETFRASAQEVRRQSGKAWGLLLALVCIFLLLILNLFALTLVGIMLAESLGGQDLAYATRLMSLGDSVFFTVMLVLAYLLLAPYIEIVRHLYHVDARTRYEGLDLWYRVRRQFPVAAASKSVAVVAGLLAGLLALAAGPCQAADELPANYVAVRDLRGEVNRVRAARSGGGTEAEAKKLMAQARIAIIAGAPAFVEGWFREDLRNFELRDEAGAREVLGILEGRLAVLEDALRPAAKLPDEATVRRLADSGRDAKPREKPPPPPPPPPPDDPPEVRDPPRVRARDASSGGGVSMPWEALAITLGVVAGIVLILGLIAYLRNREKKPKKEEEKTATAAADQALADELEQMLNVPLPPNPWSQADELARQGRLRDAVRMLYLLVLTNLHQQNCIRYERTKTNGEYAGQLRRRPELQMPFRSLTSVFERKWYGLYPCESPEYQDCRGIADQIRTEARAHG